jgi:Protein of unknown function (DUF1553)/Protein of unknown function (DUF1549)/Planctomycete cytochrome C
MRTSSSTGLILIFALPALGQDPAEVDFGRDVRPLLSDHCYTCHGFDETKRKGGLRLDTRAGAFGPLSEGGHALVPGDLNASRLVARITSDDPNERMPPPDAGKPLSSAQVETLVAWVAQGANWEEHWSFVQPVRHHPPAAGEGWARGPIDRFIAAEFEAKGLPHAPEADRETLLRRLSYDLTGLPPTLSELNEFLADGRPEAYQRQVDRLLASPRFGEHFAEAWLDGARYADTHGLHLDNERSMWRYRDWVVAALNGNMPFDEFTVEQLAGDLLPDPTQAQLIASGFNRCNPTSAEGGMIADEFLTIYARDRVDTTATVWMGLTMACVKCHDHKFDPFSMREYYQLVAFFNSLAEEATDRNIPNPVPFLRAPDDEQRAQLAGYDQRLAQLEREVDAPMPEVDVAQLTWEADWSERLEERWRILVPRAARSTGGTTLTIGGDDACLATGANPAKDVYEVEAFAAEGPITAVRLDALVDPNGASLPGRATNNNFVLTGFELEAYPPGRPDLAQPVKFSHADATHSQTDFPITAALDGNPETGWAGIGRDGDRSAVFIATEPFGFEGGTHLRFRLRHESRFAQHTLGRFRLAISADPSLSWSSLGPWYELGILPAEDGRAVFDQDLGPEGGVKLDETWRAAPEYVDGQVHRFPPEVGSVYLYRTIESPSAREMTVGLGSDDGLRVWVNGRLVHDNPAARGVALDQDTVVLPLVAGSNQVLLKVVNFGGDFGFAFRRLSEQAGGLPGDVALLLADPAGSRDPAQAARLRRLYRGRHAPAWVELLDARDALRAERTAFEQSLPTTLISRELETPRPSYLLLRGAYDRKGEEVQRAVPAAFPGLPEDAPLDRLGLARWLVSGHHPLTARVTVNRYWQQLFGTGIVKTTEDFGAQGEFPSHPELLDWLAVEFVESGWNVKALLRTMVTSAAYRQDSALTPALLERDPENRLLARGPRFRLPAEAIRDTALLVSGLLVEEVGGPGVRPYQPDGVWFAVGYTSSNTARYRQDDGQALWRRSLYTFWKRTAPPPNMVTFDAPNREACSVQRSRTVTPQQALVLWNDPTFVEAARHLAARVLREGGANDAGRLTWAYRTVVGRAPSAAQLQALLRGLETQRAHFQADPAQAAALLGVGDSPSAEDLDPVEHATWTNVSTLLLSLPQTLTRG